jgi:uncharacterized protein YcbK (DUF882 family)
VISGYRSPATSDALRSHGDGVAAGSLHLVGQAIDVRLPDVKTSRLRDAPGPRGRRRRLLPASDFVHLDTGRVRRW